MSHCHSCGGAIGRDCWNPQECAEITERMAMEGRQPDPAASPTNTAGLEEIISDAEIIRVHGHANFGPTMTPREVVNDGVRKYAVGYSSGHTQLCILLEHGLITKPRPGRYEASLTKKGKRYARALGVYQDAVTAASAQARIAELEAENQALTKALTGLTCGGSEFFVRKGERYVADIKACVDWVRRCKEDAHHRTVKAISRAQAAEARADRLATLVKRLSEDLSAALERAYEADAEWVKAKYPNGASPIRLLAALQDQPK